MTASSYVIDGKFSMRHPMHLILKPKKRLFRSTIFRVLDANGNQLLRIVKADSLTSHGWLILDATNSPVATLRQKAFSWHEQWIVYRGKKTQKKDLLFKVKRQDKRTLNVIMGSTRVKKKARGDFSIVGSPPTIYQGDSMIAAVNNNFSWGGNSVKKGGFKVQVSAGTDYVFIMSLIMIYREMATSSSLKAETLVAGVEIAAAVVSTGDGGGGGGA